MATEQDIIDATYIKKTNQIKLTIKKVAIPTNHLYYLSLLLLGFTFLIWL